MSYRAPVAEMRFLIDAVLGGGRLAETGRFAEATPETVEAVLSGAARLAEEVMAPLRRAGDLEPARLVNGVVRCTPGFPEAYRAIAEGGWIGLTADPEQGGSGLPTLLLTCVNEMMAGATPIRTAVSAKVLRGPATTMSHAPISPIPPARTCPSRAAITGLGHSTIERSSAVSSRARPSAASNGSPPVASERSAPAQKVPPVWPRTTARTAGSVSARRSPSCNCATSRADRALRLCGESSVSRATCPSTA